MAIKVLVTYASKKGATAQIAERVGRVLQQAGLQTDILPVDGAIDPSSYQAVILGSAVYIGQWQKKAAAFLKANEGKLAQRPVWLFSSGPTGQGDPVKLTNGWRFPNGLQPIADRIHPRDIALFHGSLELQKMNWLEKWMIKNVKAEIGDFRDWEAITAWANSIAAALRETP